MAESHYLPDSEGDGFRKESLDSEPFLGSLAHKRRSRNSVKIRCCHFILGMIMSSFLWSISFVVMLRKLSIFTSLGTYESGFITDLGRWRRSRPVANF